MWGIFGKPLKRAFRRCRVRGGIRNHIFSKIGHYRLTGWVFFACSSPVSGRLHRTLTPITPTYGHMRDKSFGWICCI